MEHPYLTHQTEIFKIFMLFYDVCCVEMSTSGHLMFKNVYCIIAEQDIEVST